MKTDRKYEKNVCAFFSVKHVNASFDVDTPNMKATFPIGQELKTRVPERITVLSVWIVMNDALQL